MTTEHEQQLELKLTKYKDIDKQIEENKKMIKNLLKAIPKHLLIQFLKEQKIIKVDYITKEITEQ